MHAEREPSFCSVLCTGNPRRIEECGTSEAYEVRGSIKDYKGTSHEAREGKPSAGTKSCQERRDSTQEMKSPMSITHIHMLLNSIRILRFVHVNRNRQSFVDMSRRTLPLSSDMELDMRSDAVYM